MSAPTSLVSKTVIAGYLVKQGHFVKNFKRRWVVITDTLLQYFVSEPKVAGTSGTFLKGTLSLKNATVQQVKSEKPFSFEINNGEKNLLLVAETESQMLEWIAAINDVNRPLHRAARSGDINTVSLILSTAAAPPLNDVDHNDRTALYYAARNNMCEILRLFLQRGANKNVMSNDGHTPLWIAAHNGHEDVVGELLDVGAAVERPEQVKLCGTPLLAACRNNHLTVASMLLDAHASVNPPVHPSLGTPLSAAAAHANGLELCRLLCSRGADVNIRLSDGGTALHVAAAAGHGDICQVLLDAGANYTVLNHQKQTPLQLASVASTGDAVSVLLTAGAAFALARQATEPALNIVNAIEEVHSSAENSPHLQPVRPQPTRKPLPTPVGRPEPVEVIDITDPGARLVVTNDPSYNPFKDSTAQL